MRVLREIRVRTIEHGPVVPESYAIAWMVVAEIAGWDLPDQDGFLIPAAGVQQNPHVRFPAQVTGDAEVGFKHAQPVAPEL